MRIIYTDSLDLSGLLRDEKEWIYCAFDSMITREIKDRLDELPDVGTGPVYDFMRALQNVALTLMQRGVRVDERARVELQFKQMAKLNKLESWIARLAEVYLAGKLNPRSIPQLKVLFYERLGLPPIIKSIKGEKRVMMDREALEKLRANYYAAPMCHALLSLRDESKKAEILNAKLSPDRRFRASFNVAGTDTGRWSSSKHVFGWGHNMQNITPEMRVMFVADEGYIMAYPDLEQAESFAVAYLSGDARYIQACESGDLHTSVARLIWPDLPWTGDLEKDRVISERPYYRHFSYRDIAKRGGHATNYLVSAWTLARHLKVKTLFAEEFQENYFGVFTGIPAWHKNVARELVRTGTLVTPLLRRRLFFDRLNDEHTLRKAVAYLPQSTIGDLFNLGFYRIWHELDRTGAGVQLLGQLHDGGPLQYKEDRPELLNHCQELMTIPVPINEKVMTVPVSMKVGYNWRDLVSPEKLHLLQRPNTDVLDAVM